MGTVSASCDDKQAVGYVITLLLKNCFLRQWELNMIIQAYIEMVCVKYFCTSKDVPHLQRRGVPQITDFISIPMVNWVLLLPSLLIFSLAGCTSTCIITDDSSDVTLSYRETRAWANNKTIFVEINQKPGMNLAQIIPIFYEGNIYLKQQLRSGGGKGLEVLKVDLGRYDLPANWNDHVYWITSSSWDNLAQVIFFRRPLPQHVGRMKVSIEKRANEN